MKHNQRGRLHEPNDADRRRAERFARMVQIRIEQRFWVAAHAAVDAAERDFAAQADDGDRVGLGSTDLDVRTVNALEEHHGVLYVDELAELAVDELLGTPNVGETTLRRINQVLFEHGFDQKWPAADGDAAC